MDEHFLHSLFNDAIKLLEEVDDRACIVAPERRAGRHGDAQFEFRVRLFIERFRANETRVNDLLEEKAAKADGYVLTPLPKKPVAETANLLPFTTG